MDSSAVDFLKFAVRGEVSSTGGYINLVGILVLACSVSGAESRGVLAQTYRFFYTVIDRVFHFLEKVMEYRSDSKGGHFKASPKPEVYEPPEGEARVRPLLALCGFTVLCMFAVGAVGYIHARH